MSELMKDKIRATIKKLEQRIQNAILDGDYYSKRLLEAEKQQLEKLLKEM